jgi:hypothetical protein
MKKLGSLFLLALACGPISQNPVWTKPCGGDVRVSVSAITLGDPCGSSGAPALRDSEFADCAVGGCGCRQSSLQLDVVSTAHTPANIVVRAVRLYDSKTGALVDTLSASNARQWLNNQYSPWNQQVAPTSTVKAMYDLSAPTYGAGAAPTGRSSYYSTTYKTEVDVEVDGELRTLTGPDAQREPEVVT